MKELIPYILLVLLVLSSGCTAQQINTIFSLVNTYNSINTLNYEKEITNIFADIEIKYLQTYTFKRPDMSKGVIEILSVKNLTSGTFLECSDIFYNPELNHLTSWMPLVYYYKNLSYYNPNHCFLSFTNLSSEIFVEEHTAYTYTVQQALFNPTYVFSLLGGINTTEFDDYYIITLTGANGERIEGYERLVYYIKKGDFMPYRTEKYITKGYDNIQFDESYIEEVKTVSVNEEFSDNEFLPPSTAQIILENDYWNLIENASSLSMQVRELQSNDSRSYS